jgi:hypothetical protein
VYPGRKPRIKFSTCSVSSALTAQPSLLQNVHFPLYCHYQEVRAHSNVYEFCRVLENFSETLSRTHMKINASSAVYLVLFISVLTAKLDKGTQKVRDISSPYFCYQHGNLSLSLHKEHGARDMYDSPVPPRSASGSPL